MITFPKIFSAIGHHFSAYLHSLFLFLFGTVRKNLAFFTAFRFGGAESGQQQPPQPQPHLLSASSSDISVEEDGGIANNITSITNTSINITTTITTRPSLSEGNQPGRDDDGHFGVDYEDDNEDEMAATATAPTKRAALPKVIPALPLAPIVSRRDSSTSMVGVMTKQDDVVIKHLSDDLVRMRVVVNGQQQTPPTEQQQETVVVPAAWTSQSSAGASTNDNNNNNNNNNNDDDQKGLLLVDKENQALNDANTAAGRDKTREREQAPLEASLNPTTRREVVRSLPVPIIHEVSQNSNLKDPTVAAAMVSKLDLVRGVPELDPETPEQAAERAIHSGFMRDALDMARLALRTNETPVGCVLVYQGRVIAKGMNATNVTRNGTRHAELMAICALLSYSPASDLEDKNKGSSTKGKQAAMPLGDMTNAAKQTLDDSAWGDVDPGDGHLFPYGQKLHPAPRVDRSVITECILYVTVEPCIMCASLLRQLGIKKVYFGAVNDKFGGTGGVFRIHKNSPHSVMASAPPSPSPQNGKGLTRPILERRPASTTALQDCQSSSSGDEKSDIPPDSPSQPPIDPSALPGDGGNVERGYEVEGGWGRDEAVTLLRQFYVQENGRAPVPRKKEGRAARLAAMMERDGHAGGPIIPVDASVDLSKTSSEDGELNTNEQKEGDSDDSPVELAACACEVVGGEDKAVIAV